MPKILLSLCLALLSFAAVASDVIDIHSTPAHIRDAQGTIKLAVERREGVYKDMETAERQEIFKQQAVVLRVLEGKDSIGLLNEPQKVELANALESINALVTKAEDDRKVCERVKVVGSNRPQNVCMTVGQRRRLRDTAQREGIKTTN